jgi:3-phosphoshikimate 1-carboxyvinyltransferase
VSDPEHSGAPPVELAVEPLGGPIDSVVRPPGSKSITNRALVCAALAEGASRLEGALFADDTEAMLGCLHDLGVGLRFERAAERIDVRGVGGLPGGDGSLLDARMSGTTARFVMPVAALGRATAVLDGSPSLRARPMGDLIDALASLGAAIEPLGEPGFLPVQIDGGGLDGGSIRVRGDVSSQFLSGLLLAAPCMRDGLEVQVSTELVSVPYVQMTVAVMEAFGAHVEVADDHRRVVVAPGGYAPVDEYRVEPDASAASYFFAAAALLGGRVRVEGLGRAPLQGDVAFVDVLERMGAEVVRQDGAIEVRGSGTLRGVDVDMADFSDTAQTLAAIAPFADSPTMIRGIGFIRGKETDRIAAVVTELQRLGVDARELPDGIVVHPGRPRPGTVRTYDDHRMAMSFSLIGLRTPGIRILDPGCVAKTFPGYWSALDALRPAHPDPPVAPDDVS